MKSISNLEGEIRDLINHPRKRYFLLKDPAQWYKLCSSMDAIGDTEIAIDSYLESLNKPAQTGELYIFLYGILQVLFVQQDAVKHLNEALELKYEPNKSLEAIREIRNDSIGHPTKRGGGKGHAFNFITRISMTRAGFTLITTYPDRNSTFKEVNVRQLISEQRDELRKTLENAISYLNKEAMEHKNRHKDEKLADIFHPSLHYYYEKIGEAIFGNSPKEFGAGILNLVAEIPKTFKEALVKREIFEAYDLEDVFEWTEYPLSKLMLYFEGTVDNLNNKDAYIYLSYLRKQIDELHQIAKEIDEDYEAEQQS